MNIGPKSQSTLAFLQKLVAGINANQGVDNCAHCALRFDEHIARGENLGLGAVPTEDARLGFHPFIKKGKIESSFTKDQRIIDRTTAPPKDHRVIIYVDEQSGTTLEIDLTTGSQPQDRVHFISASKGNIIQALQALPRRQKDGTAYGFIVLTHKKRNDLAHILNYFVDNDNEVYFIDAQESDLTKQVVEKLDLSGYQSEIFYRPSIPPEGIRVKKEPKVIIKQESDILMKNEVDIFIDKVAEAAIAKNDKQLKSLLSKSSAINACGSDELTVVMRLLQGGQKEAAEFLVSYGAKLEDFVCYAAFTQNEELAKQYEGRMRKQKLTPDLNRVAAYAIKGGHPRLASRILDKRKRNDVLQNQSQNIDPLPRTQALIFNPLSTAFKMPSLFERRTESISREKIKLLQAELAIKDKRIALQEEELALKDREIAALRKKLNEKEPEANRHRKSPSPSFRRLF